MVGTGTLINVVAVLIGGGLGMLLGTRLPERVRETIMHCLGLVVLAMGISLSLESQNVLIVLGSLLLGGILGEILRIEDRVNGLGRWFERITSPRETVGSREASENDPPKKANWSDVSQFSRAFLSASLLFCVGPMAILGSIQDGLNSDFSLLAIKSVLDGFASLAFASTLGPGVLFAALAVFVYQGALTLGAGWASAVLSDPMIAEMTATGGVLMLGLGLGLLELKRIRVGNLLPALLIAPLIVLLVNAISR